MKHGKILILIFAIGIILRLLFLCVSVKYLPVDSDEAMLGLMAKRVLLGEYPLMTWVQPHGGTLEAYLNAPMYLIFRTGKLTVRFLPLVFSILFLILSYLIGKEYFGKEAGIITVSLAAIPPVYLSIMGALGISMNFPALLGSAVIIYLAHRITFGRLSPLRKLFLLIIMGLTAGAAFWVHLILICAVISALLLFFIADRLFFIRRNFWVLVLSFIIGSSPLWIHNFNTGFSTFRMVHSAGTAETLSKLKMCFSFTLPAAWGLYLPTYIDCSYFIRIWRGFSVPYAGVCIILVALAIVTAVFRNKTPETKMRRSGAAVLLFFFLLNIAVFARNSRSNSCSTRYLTLTFIALLPVIGAGLAWVLKKSKIVFGLILTFLLAFNLAGNIMVMRAWARQGFPEEHLCLPEKGELISFLENENIRHGYMHYWLSYPVTFMTDERIKISPAYDERFGRYVHPYLKEVNEAARPAYIFHTGVGLRAGWFEGELKRIGAGFRKKKVNSFTVFYDFKPPVSGTKPLEKDEFILDANCGKKNLPLAMDGDHTTRWGTGSPQSPGMFFAVDTGKIHRVCGAVLYLGGFRHDFPRGYKVYVSVEGKDWKEVYNSPFVAGRPYWDGNKPRLYTGEERIRIVFKPVDVRWIKFVLTDSDPRMDWSITEFDILKEQ